MKRIFLLALVCTVWETHAAQIMVNTDEFANSTNGNCSLSEAVLSAGFNLGFDQCTAGSGNDEIVFDVNLFNNILNTMTVDFTDTLPVFSESLAITVPNGKVLWLRGNGQDPLMTVSLIANTTFSLNNTQFSGGESSAPGGALVFSGQERVIELDNVWFFSNHSGSDGGALAFNRDAALTHIVNVTINDGHFNDNSSDGTGGAIHAPEDYRLVIDGGVFLDNSAMLNGGAIAVGDSLQIADAEFDGNQAGSGGAIYSSAGLLQVSDSVLQNNQAVTSGGGIYKTAHFTETADTLILERTSVLNNFSEGTGGVQASYNNLVARNNLFADNVSTLGVGGLYLFMFNANDGDHDVHLIGNTFYHNLSHGVNAAAEGDLDVTFSANRSSFIGNAMIGTAQSGVAGLCDLNRTAQIVSAHNLSNLSSGCLVGSTNQILAPANAALLATGGFHPSEVVPQPGSPLIDAWLNADCLDETGSPLEFDLTGERGLFGVIFDGDDDGVRDCDIGSTEAYEGVMLSVITTGAGTGSVISAPVGIDCNPNCNLAFPLGSEVILSAAAAADSEFIGWSGAGCSGVGNCVITVPDVSGLNVQAEFQPAQTHTLQVVKTGDGSGLVESDLSGIHCGASCSASFVENSVIKLTATADANNQFVAWGGDCVASGNQCTVTLTADTLIDAQFDSLIQPLQVSLAGQGSGLLSSTPGGIACPTDCEHNYDTGTMVTLSFAPDPDTTFIGWSGDCSGTGACVVNMDQPHQVTADIDVLHAVNVGVVGPGSVVSAPAGIDCPGDCDEIYSNGQFVQLLATAEAHALFAGWQGDCSGTGNCAFNVTAEANITAVFEWEQHQLSINATAGGDVTSTDGGIACGAVCAADYDYNSAVQLNAVPDAGFRFVGWSGGGTCTGDALSCAVIIQQDITVNAVFENDVIFASDFDN